MNIVAQSVGRVRLKPVGHFLIVIKIQIGNIPFFTDRFCNREILGHIRGSAVRGGRQSKIDDKTEFGVRISLQSVGEGVFQAAGIGAHIEGAPVKIVRGTDAANIGIAPGIVHAAVKNDQIKIGGSIFS